MALGWRVQGLNRGVSDFCDEWLQGGQKKFQPRCVSDCCDEWLKAGNYNI